MVVYDWDDKKEEENIRRRKIGFTEAATVFKDPFLHTAHDRSENYEEDRFLAIGQSTKGRYLLVVYCERGFDEEEIEVVRIISARKLEPHEKRAFEKGRGRHA